MVMVHISPEENEESVQRIFKHNLHFLIVNEKSTSTGLVFSSVLQPKMTFIHNTTLKLVIEIDF